MAYFLGDVEDALIAVPVYYHLPPGDRWTLIAAPATTLGEQEGEYGLRLGLTYSFLLGKTQVKPSVFADLIAGEEALLFGVSFGRGF